MKNGRMKNLPVTRPFIKWIADKVAWFVYNNTNSKYLRECVDHFYQNHPIGWHWQYIELPKVRQVFSETLATQLMSVQPMDQPSGLLFELNFDDSDIPMYVPEPGDWGHSFLDGWYIYNEDCNQIFMDNEEEYNRLYETYKDKNPRQRKINTK